MPHNRRVHDQLVLDRLGFAVLRLFFSFERTLSLLALSFGVVSTVSLQIRFLCLIFSLVSQLGLLVCRLAGLWRSAVAERGSSHSHSQNKHGECFHFILPGKRMPWLLEHG